MQCLAYRETMDAHAKIDAILSWAQGRKFDTAFVQSVQDYLDLHGHVTSSQENALDNIIERWRVGENPNHAPRKFPAKGEVLYAFGK